MRDFVEPLSNVQFRRMGFFSVDPYSVIKVTTLYFTSFAVVYSCFCCRWYLIQTVGLNEDAGKYESHYLLFYVTHLKQ